MGSQGKGRVRQGKRESLHEGRQHAHRCSNPCTMEHSMSQDSLPGGLMNFCLGKIHRRRKGEECLHQILTQSGVNSLYFTGALVWHQEVPTVSHNCSGNGDRHWEGEWHAVQAQGPWSGCAFVGPCRGSWNRARGLGYW